jgi:hypothetical protein
MAQSYDDAIRELYRAQQADFVSERKRLSNALKATGDKSGAARLAKLTRPTLSAWAVNQLFWQNPSDFEELFATAKRLRRGELGAMPEHRRLLASLTARAATLLRDSGHAASDAISRRVTANLSAIAAAGGFAPDPAGALTSDRDPPGFEAIDAASFGEPPVQLRERTKLREIPERDEPQKPAKQREERTPAKQHEAQKRAATEHAAREREQKRLEKERRERERAKRETERRRLNATLSDANRQLKARSGEAERLERELAAARARVEASRQAVRDVEARLAALEDEDV